MPLSGSNLIARYYFDEASSGTGPTVVNDASGNAYHLNEYSYDSGYMNWTADVDGNRGLESTVMSSTHFFRRKAVTSDALLVHNGTKKLTWEVVINKEMIGSTNYQRCIALHRRINTSISPFSITTGDTTLIGTVQTAASPTDGRFCKYLNYSQLAAGRNVVHFVFDSTQATEANRILFYVNGTLATQTDAASPDVVALDHTYTLTTDMDLIVFNRGDTGTFARSPEGILYYAALYADALTTTQIADNADILLARDDKIPSLSLPGVQNIASTTATPKVTLTY
jgi:hypothetical protein